MKVLIIGAGFSGLCAAIKLSEADIPFVVFEKAPEVGGTWWFNTYPGCACDIESHLYSFSFAPNNNWSRSPEILEYLRQTATKYNLYPHIKLNTEVISARFNAESGLWLLRTKSGEEHTGEVLIGGQGFLHVPHMPPIKGPNLIFTLVERGLGAESFKGEIIHTANWKKDFSSATRNICVIGNAASAVQAVPELAKNAKSITLFQRTPNWFVPKADFKYSAFVMFLFQWVPFLRLLYRWFLYLRHEFYFMAFSPNSAFGRRARRDLRTYIGKQLKDKPELVPIVTPSYPPGCKRIILEDNYLPLLAQSHVKLITTPIDEISADGIVSGGQLHTADAIVYATGFAPGAGGFGKFYGTASAASLEEVWGDEPFAYLGITVPGFPNLFLLLGPNTGLGHNSVVWMIECQVNYTVQCIQAMVAQRIKLLEVRRDVSDRYCVQVQQRLQDTVWSRGNCRSWYQSAKGTIFALWPGSTYSYWWTTRCPQFSDYHIRPYLGIQHLRYAHYRAAHFQEAQRKLQRPELVGYYDTQPRSIVPRNAIASGILT